MLKKAHYILEIGTIYSQTTIQQIIGYGEANG